VAKLVEVEKLALALSADERATLAAKLIASLSANKSRHDAESDAAGFKNVKSSMLRKVRYDAQTRFLDVVFRTGETYRYKDVPPDEYHGLMEAQSHGKYMQGYIIDNYDVVRLDD